MSKSCKLLFTAGGELDGELGVAAILFIWKSGVQRTISFRALEIQKQKVVSLCSVSRVFLASIISKTFSLHSLASLQLLWWFLRLLTVPVSDTLKHSHRHVFIHMTTYVSSDNAKRIHSDRKPSSCQVTSLLTLHNLVCKTVVSAAAAIYFRKKLSFPLTWVQEQDKYFKVPQLCLRSAVGIWGRWDKDTPGRCLLEHREEQGKGCPALLCMQLGLPCRQHRCAHK